MFKHSVIGKLVHHYRYKLAITYTLFALEMTGALLRPLFLGWAINDLMSGSYKGLIYLSVVHIAWLLIGTFRQMYDTRTYSAIYTTMVTRFLSRRYGKTEVSKLSAHSTLSRELVDFLETDLPYVMEAAYNIFGSLLLLLLYDRTIVLICFSILLPVMAISYFYGRKMKQLTSLKNDELEKQVNIIATGNKHQIHGHYEKLRAWQIRISDKEAFNFGLIEIMVMLVIALSLMVSSGVFGATILAGNLIGIYQYILKFVSGLDTIPYTVQRLTSLQDIAKRIQLQEEDISGSLRPVSPINEGWKQGELKLSA